MRYRLIGIDLDGTLLDSDGNIPQANRDAIARAQAQGVMVVPCTGRSWRESHFMLRHVPGIELGVFVTGASICRMSDGNAMDLATIESHLAHEVVELLRDLPEAVLVLRESSVTGHDYLVTGNGRLTGNTRWWLDVTGSTAHFQQQVTPDDLHHSLRVSVVTPYRRVRPLAEALEQAMDGRAIVQHFGAVPMPDPDQTLHVLEVFASGVDKWRGLSWIAQQQGIDPQQIAVIGDQINDVAMLSAAGCGIAMGNAVDCARTAADRVTLTNDQCGVAHAIEQMLSGGW